MKVLLIFFISVAILIAATPTRQTLTSYSKTLGAGSSDTSSVSNILMDGDSLGIILEVSQDSISGQIRYEYTSPQGYTNGTAFGSLPVLATFSSNEKGVFTTSIPMIAGAERVRLYILTTNNKTALQVINFYVYAIKWR